jgi:catechol-2,3-dioxygenase
MVVAARQPRANAAFLRLPRSGNHHDLGLSQVGTAATPKRSRGIGLYHLAWQLDTIDELAEIRQAVNDAGAYTGESSHGAVVAPAPTRPLLFAGALRGRRGRPGRGTQSAARR